MVGPGSRVARLGSRCREPVGNSHLSLCSLTLGTGSTLMIVTEYMSHGALDGFLRVSGWAQWADDRVAHGALLSSLVGLGISITALKGAHWPDQPCGSQCGQKPSQHQGLYMQPWPLSSLSSAMRASWWPCSCWACCLGWHLP